MLEIHVRIGGGSRIRTGDMLLAKQPLYQLSYTPDALASSRRNRASDEAGLTLLCPATPFGFAVAISRIAGNWWE